MRPKAHSDRICFEVAWNFKFARKFPLHFACFNFGLVKNFLPDVALAVRTSQILTISEPKATRRYYRSILQIIWAIYCEMCNKFARIKHCCQIQWP